MDPTAEEGFGFTFCEEVCRTQDRRCIQKIAIYATVVVAAYAGGPRGCQAVGLQGGGAIDLYATRPSTAT